MTTPARPSAARRHTRTTTENTNAELDKGIRIALSETEVYEARYGDVTPQIARRLRAATGYSWNTLLALCAQDPDLDVVATFMWVCQLISGEDTDLDDIKLSYADILAPGFAVDVKTEATEGDPTSPEA